MAIAIIGKSGTVLETDVGGTNLCVNRRAQPINVGAFGSYKWVGQTGTMAAGIASNAVWFSFRWASPTGVCVLRKIRCGMMSLATGFTAGNGYFEARAARAFSVAHTGGTASAPIGDAQKKLARHNSTRLSPAVTLGDMRIATTAALGGGTVTLDGAPFASTSFTVTTATNATMLQKDESGQIFAADGMDAGKWPFCFQFNEGFVLRCTVPATGTWTGHAEIAWDELPDFP